jgi:hypothetical protein
MLKKLRPAMISENKAFYKRVNRWIDKINKIQKETNEIVIAESVGNRYE